MNNILQEKVIIFLFLFLLIESFIYAGTAVEIDQKEWIEYFPSIEKYPSVYESEFERAR